MNRMRLVAVAVMTAAVGGGCGKEDGQDSTALYEAVFSEIYREFGTQVLTAGGTIETQDYHVGLGSWNTKTLRGTHEFRGILTITGGAGHCGEVLRQVEAFVASRTNRYHIEGDVPSQIQGTERHVHTMWMYNLGKRHGELRMWLFPYPAGNHVGFAVHHYEEKLK